jgi:hypothetical protein
MSQFHDEGMSVREERGMELLLMEYNPHRASSLFRSVFKGVEAKVIVVKGEGAKGVEDKGRN